MNHLRLVGISIKDKQDNQIYDMLQDIDQEENGFGNEVFGLSKAEFDSYIDEKVKDKDERTVKSGFAPQTISWLYEGQEAVGFSKMMHHLNDQFRVDCGHLGYAIRKKERSQGYGKKLVELTLEEFKKIGVNEVLVVCESSNTVSKTIIESNGGTLDKVSDEKCFYWISL